MTNFVDSIWRYADQAPEREALRCGEDRWNYGRLREAIAQFGGALRARGVGPGTRAILVAPTVPEFAVAYYGMQAAGAAVVAMNPMATSYEIGYVLDDADCSLLVAWHECAEAGELAAAQREVEMWRLAPGAGGLPQAPPLDRPHDAAADDTAVILYTSGTTGNPKGAELTHDNLIACAETFTEVLEITGEDVLGTALPLFHVFGGTIIMGTALSNGASVSMLSRFDPVKSLELISGGGLTVFSGVPTMYNALLHAADGQYDLSRLRFCCSGGASLPDEVLRAFDERFGIVILEGYGLTETSGGATFNGLHRRRKPGLVGIPLPGIEVRVVDAQGAELATGEVGEVVIRGRMVMKGYYGRPEATAETIRDGWLHSGDLGTKDADGDLQIVGREKDLIIRGGYNVYPQEIEQVLYTHPDVVEAAVVGVDDPHFGEEVAAFVVCAPNAELDAEALHGWTRERLSAYKAPRLFRFMEALPKGATGKILKRGLEPEDLVDVRAARQ